MKMRIVVDHGALVPTRAHDTDAGLDLYAYCDSEIPAEGYAMFDTGVHVEIPKGYVGMLTSKSGLMGKGITSRGTIDCGYTGSIRAILYNHSKEPFKIARGQKITQLVIMPIVTPKIEIVAHLDKTDRGDGGFGSTGIF